MFIIERQYKILEMLEENGFISVDDLCKRLYASGATIRRDLTEMENANLLQRVWGGAVLFDGISHDPPSILRNNRNIEEKIHIAHLASNLLKDSLTVFMDGSSTVVPLAKMTANFNNISIITNGIETAYQANQASSSKIFFYGGEIINHTQAIGSTVLEAIKNRYADIYFYSCNGLSIENGCTETNEEVSQIKRCMLHNSKMHVLLCDHTKFGLVFSCKFCELEQIDVLITDVAPSSDFLNKMPSSIKLIV